MIDQLKPVYWDKIVVELPPRVETLSNGFAAFDSDNNRPALAPKYGFVLSVSDEEKEIQVGDTIYFSYQVLESARSQSMEGLLIKEGARWAVVLRREDVFFIQRGDKRIALNDFSLVSPFENKKDTHKGFRLSQRDSRLISASEGIVRLIGDNQYGIKEGDLVLFEENADLPLEYDLTKTIETLYRIKTHELVVKLNQKLNYN